MGLGKFLDEWTTKKIQGRSTLSRRELDDYTSRRLHETISHAYENSSFYKEKYEECDLKDIASLPFTTPEELRNRGLDLLCVKPGEISRVVTLNTGGTTGLPKRVYFTEEDQMLTVDFFENGMQLIAGVEDKVLILMPAKVPGSIGKLLSKGLAGFGAVSIEYGLPDMGPAKSKEENVREVRKILELVKEEKVTGVVALPTHMNMLTTEANGEKLDWVLLSAEYVDEEICRKLTATFGCKVYEHYGTTEMGLGCAVSCGCGEGYHIREADLYIEIIDPNTGENVPDGEWGEIVFTTLTRKGMPFIRYRTGDFSRFITEECSCGSILKRLDKVGPRDLVKGYLKGE